MNQPTHTKSDIQDAIDELIECATRYDTDALERIYHEDLHIVMVGVDNSVRTHDKESFIELFAEKKKMNAPQMGRWVKYHHVHIQGNDAVIVLDRINDVAGVEMKLKCSIDLVFEDGRWQVLREEIFLQPLHANN
ncbi:MAG: nuclear transport factor 2 family protein [Gammaproteobacteria bacterium]|nr:nuclear transport factor 2 family protein [Gammaproteobacteria bacterium]